MNFLEKTPIKGIFEYKVFKKGKLIEYFVDNNLVVNVAKTALANLVGGDGAGKVITQISFGTDETTPNVSNTSITNPYTKTLNSHEYPAAGQIKFLWSLGTAEANGKSIKEFGLICSDTSLFARIIRSTGAIDKDVDISLEGTWTIIF